MVDISSLNPQQYEAAAAIHGPVMILAGAGTGKTRVITYRIGHMLDCDIRPNQIVALTFTNKAAREMKERVQDLVRAKLTGLKIGTFHSFCLFLLRRYPEQAGLHPRFGLVGTGDQLDLIRRSLEERNWHGLYKPEELLSRISRAKNALLRPEQVVTDHNFHAVDDDPELLSQVYAIYERQLNLHRVIDFDDCIFRAARLLEQHPDLLQQLQNEYTHYLVDEFQDTNFSQLYVLELLAGKDHNICAVGDDDQSIYSWRGAMVETIDRFEKIFPGTKLIKLEQNYRCTNIILSAANHVIRNNSGRKSKTLWSESDSQTYITVAAKPDDVSEAKWIASKCFAQLGQGRRLKDIGILYRANSQARNLELALREHGLHYRVYGGSSFFERKEVKDFLAYFKLSMDPHDRLAFWRVINTPSRGVGLKTLERIEAAAKQQNISPFAVLEQGLVDLHGKAASSVQHFVDILKRHSQSPMVHIDDLEKRGTELIKSFGLEDDIRQKTSHEGSRRRKLESLHRLPKWLKQLAENQMEDRGELNLRDLLDYLILGDELNKSEERGDNHISLMTIHGSKGLEFPVVFVCGLEEDLLPHKNSVGSDLGLSEERRLFYVAITRAKEKLHLSYARERFSNFQKQTRKPSRFLGELPSSGVVFEDDGQQGTRVGAVGHFVSEDERKQKNLNRFSDLKNRLKHGFHKT
ncbi:MAG: ATP-dependent helicase [Oligoflexus sp.]